MTVTHASAGTPTSATGSATAPAPVWPATATGRKALLFVNAKAFSATCATPSGWTLVGTSTNGSVASGASIGSTRGYVFEKTSDGTEGGTTVTLAVTGANSAGAVIHTFATSLGAWDTTVIAWGNKVGNSANMSAVTTTQASVAAGDLMVPFFSMNSLAGTPSADTLTQTGVTYGTVTNQSDRGVSTGDDTRNRVNSVPVNSVTTPSGGATGGYTNASSTSGLLGVVRLRDVAGAAFSGPAGFSGSGTLSTIPPEVPGFTVAVGFGGSGTLSTIPPEVPGFVVTVAFSGGGTLTLVTRAGVAAAPGFSGTGTLTGTVVYGITGSAGFGGSGTLSAVGVAAQAATGTAAFSGAGSLSAVAVPSVSAVATFSGAGTLSTTRVAGVARPATFSGAGTLSVVRTFGVIKTAGFSGTGTLSATVLPKVAGTATFSGNGTLSVVAQGAGLDVATFSGSGTLTGTVVPKFAQPATFSGTGTLSATSQYGPTGTAAFAGTGTFTVVPLATLTALATFESEGTLAALITPDLQPTVAFDGEGTLSTTITVPTTGPYFARWDGTALVPLVIARWTGSAFVPFDVIIT